MPFSIRDDALFDTQAFANRSVIRRVSEITSDRSLAHASGYDGVPPAVIWVTQPYVQCVVLLGGMAANIRE